MSTDIVRLRAKLRAIQNENKDLQKKVVALENSQELSAKIKRAKKPKVVAKSRASVSDESHVPILLCSDWHVEECIDPEKVSGTNEFSLKIAQQRIRKLFDEFYLVCKRHNTKSVVIWLGGDLLSNVHHDELMEVNETKGPAETMVWLYQVLRVELRDFAKRIKKPVDVVCSYGNHGRLTDRPRIQTGAENSLEWLLYQHLRMENIPGVTVHTSKSQIQYFEVLGHNLRFTHGDAVKAGGNSLHSGMSRTILAWDSATPASHTFIGHWHHYLPHQQYTVNGSLIGYGPYTIRIGAHYERPSQAWTVWGKEGLLSMGRILVD